MTSLYVDTNVLLDFIRRRHPFDAPARKLLTFAYMGFYRLWMSASQTSDIFYIITEGGRKTLAQPAKEAIAELLDHVGVIEAGEQEIRRALGSNAADYEDALIQACAVRAGADFIIARDKRFSDGLIPAKTPEEFFDWLLAKQRVEVAQMELIDGMWKQTL